MGAAYNGVNEERWRGMKIKFDRKTAKTAKYCALICTVLLIIGVVLSFLEIVFCPSAGIRLRSPG